MCGRFALAENAEVIVEAFRCAKSNLSTFKPSFNIAPTQLAPVIRQQDGVREATVVRWGLVPGWAKDVNVGSRMINARCETVAEKPAYRSAFAFRRCIVPASAFYEWEATPQGKQPFAFTPAGGGLLALAGLWERWEKGPEPVESFTILTTSANELLGRIHDRMPVILEPEGVETWLDAESSPSALGALLVPMANGRLGSHPVSRKVNSPKNNSSDLLDPVVDGLF